MAATASSPGENALTPSKSYGLDDPELYLRAGTLQYEDVEMIMALMGHTLKFQPHDRILDIGCGPGNVTKNVIEARSAPNSEIIGLDVSENMIRFASEHYPGKGISYIRLDANDVGELQQYYPLGFTHVFSFFTFHWLVDYQKVLFDLQSMMRDESTLFLVFLESVPLFEAYGELARDSKFSEHLQGVENHMGIFSGVADPPAVFTEALDKSGFIPTDIRSIKRSMTYSDTDHALNALKSVNPWKRFMTPELEHEFVLAVLETMKPSLTFGPTGDITVSYSLMSVMATPASRLLPEVGILDATRDKRHIEQNPPTAT